MRVLVAWASRHGATQGIAERVADTLKGQGLDVAIQPADRATDAEQYDAFVVGGAAYMFHWMKEAAEFVRRNEDLLATRPTWLFSSGPLGPDEIDPKTGKNPRETSTPREFADLERRIQPRGVHIFYGAWDPDSKPVGVFERFMSLTPARGAMPAGDFRNWPEIEAWAREIGDELQKQAVASPT